MHADSRRAARALALCGLFSFALLLYYHRRFFHDDAFISLRYARNWLTRGELSWNPGERVEGYTNFLHLSLAAGLMRLGLDGVAAVRAVNALGVLLLVDAVLRGVARLPASVPLTRALAAFLLLSAAPLAVWLLGGLEAVLLAGLVACAFATLLPLVTEADAKGWRRAALAGVWFGLAYLTRPDALVMCWAALAALLVCAPHGYRKRLGLCALLGGVTGSVVLAHLAFRLAYYGDAVPNTFHAKVGLPLAHRLSTGLPYLAKGLLALPALAGALLLAAWALRGRAVGDARERAPLSRALVVLTLPLAAHCAYVAWAGGDHMPAARLLVPALGVAALLCAAGLSALSARARVGATSALALAALAGATSVPHSRMDGAAFVGSIVGHHIAQTWPPGALVALHTAGATPYFAPALRFIDMLGLNDRTIARRQHVPLRTPWQSVPGHGKGDGAYVLARKPAFIIAGPAEGGPVERPLFLSDAELNDSAELRRCYREEHDVLAVKEELARELPWMPHPLVFTYYRRVCTGE